jgi:hypothetical protein
MRVGHFIKKFVEKLSRFGRCDGGHGCLLYVRQSVRQVRDNVNCEGAMV